MSTPKLRKLSVSQLTTCNNIRSEYGDLTALAGTFINDQPDAPPVVYSNGDGYIVAEGNRRVLSAQQAGITHLWCVVKAIAPDDLAVRQLVADLQHKELEPLERAHALRDILDASDDTQAELAEQLGRSPTEISQSLALLELCKGAQEALRRGYISEGIAELLIPLDHDDQRRMLPDILRAKGPRSRKPTVGQAKKIIKDATMTAEERKNKEEAALADAIREIEQYQPKCDAFYALEEAADPEQTIHVLFLYEVMHAEDLLTSAWSGYNREGCSEALRKKVNRAAIRIMQLAKKIEEVSK